MLFRSGSGTVDAGMAGEQLAAGFVRLLKLAGLPVTLAEVAGGTPSAEVISELATDAAQQWTGTFNPRRVEAQDFASLYVQALSVFSEASVSGWR